jgi:hypothetical protein
MKEGIADIARTLTFVVAENSGRESGRRIARKPAGKEIKMQRTSKFTSSLVILNAKRTGTLILRVSRPP